MNWHVFFFVCFLISCSQECPTNSINVTLNGSLACVSTMVFCEVDGDCAHARYDCDNPCVYLPVNVANLERATEKEKLCVKQNVSCRSGPQFFIDTCIEHQCSTKTRFAEDMVVHPEYQLVDNVNPVCYQLDGKNVTVHLKVHNYDSDSILQLSAGIIGDGNGTGAFFPVTLFFNRQLLSNPLLANETRMLNLSYLRSSIGLPSNMTIFSVQHIVVRGNDAGLLMNNAHPKVFMNITECNQ